MEAPRLREGGGIGGGEGDSRPLGMEPADFAPRLGISWKGRALSCSSFQGKRNQGQINNSNLV